MKIAFSGGRAKGTTDRHLHISFFSLSLSHICQWPFLQHDAHRKPQGLIALDESCRVTRGGNGDGDGTTFQIATGVADKDKTVYLSADSAALVEEWIRVLQNVIQRQALKALLSRENPKVTLQGWITKVKHGHSKRVWCVLIGKMFIYFKTPNDQNPIGQINMRDTHVEEVEQISDSDSDETTEPIVSSAGGSDTAGRKSEPTVGIFPNHLQQQGPTYLIFPHKSEQEKWLYHLTVVSGGNPKRGTQFEQLVQRLMEEDGNPASAVWRNPLMLHSKEALGSPLTTFTNEVLQAEALKLSKSLQLFTSVVMDSAGIDYHVMLAANAIQQCLDMPELQPELLSALVKQTSRLSPLPPAPTSAQTSADASRRDGASADVSAKSKGKKVGKAKAAAS